MNDAWLTALVTTLALMLAVLVGGPAVGFALWIHDRSKFKALKSRRTQEQP